MSDDDACCVCGDPGLQRQWRIGSNPGHNPPLCQRCASHQSLKVLHHAADEWLITSYLRDWRRFEEYKDELCD